LRYGLVDYLGGATVDDRADRIDDSRAAEISWRSRQRRHNVSSAGFSRLFSLVQHVAGPNCMVELLSHQWHCRVCGSLQRT
jgi:hypothetical protein